MLNLLPAKAFTYELIEEICRSDAEGVVLSLYAELGKGRSVRGWKEKNIDLYHIATFGYYDVNEAGEKFASSTLFYDFIHHVLIPILYPQYSERFYTEKGRLREMARKFLENKEDSGEDMLEFVLDDVYNLYIYYFSMGTFPANDIFAELLWHLDFKEIKLPNTDPETYFDILFSYYKIIGIKVESEEEFERVTALARYFWTFHRGWWVKRG
jgi:hypothetical protein